MKHWKDGGRQQEEEEGTSSGGVELQRARQMAKIMKEYCKNEWRVSPSVAEEKEIEGEEIKRTTRARL